VLKELPEIEDIAIVGISDEIWGEVGHAFVIRKPAARLNAEDIVNFCKERLATFKCPRKITFCKTFPRTSLGKVLKRELIKPVL
jgi:acyl-CoA synthetase (AMP-forming)/AMP-acid ligase II